MNKLKYLPLLVATLLASCLPTTQTDPLIVTTLFPQYSLTRSLAGDLIDVVFLLPPGADSHDYEPTPTQQIQLNRAKIVFYTSHEFEPWMDALEETATGSLIDLSSVVVLKDVEEEANHSHLRPFFALDDHDHEVDPHYWLDPMNSLLMLEAIKTALITLLPEHSLLIQSRKVLLQEAFEDTLELYEGLVPANQELEIVFAGHNAFGYWEPYDIHVLTPYPGFSSDVVPTAQSVIDFQNLMTSLASQTLYISSTDNQAVIDALLENNPNITTAILSTLENISQMQREEGITYQELMLLNYEALSLNEN